MGRSSLRYGVVLAPPEPARMAELARESEAAGFDLIGVADSQSLFREMYVSMTVAALNTSRARLAPGVSNILTRHLAVTASAIATIDELSQGRAVLALGTGDSALYNLGLRPVSLERLEHAIRVLRRLVGGEDAEHDGRRVHVRWAHRRIPVYIAAEGPKTLRLAGRLADGVIVGTGLTPEVVAASLQWLEEGAREAGRGLDALDVWFFAKTNVDVDSARALNAIKMALAASANHAFRFTLDHKLVPPHLLPAVERLKQEYVAREHEQIGDTRNAALTDELGLTEYLAERFAIVGTPAQCAARLRALASVGVRQLLVTAITPDPLQFVRTWGRDVLPRVTGGGEVSA